MVAKYTGLLKVSLGFIWGGIYFRNGDIGSSINQISYLSGILRP